MVSNVNTQERQNSCILGYSKDGFIWLKEKSSGIVNDAGYPSSRPSFVNEQRPGIFNAIRLVMPEAEI